MFASLTNTELDQLNGHAYRAAMALFAAIEALIPRMRQAGLRTPELAALDHQWAILRAAAAEQQELFSELSAEIRERIRAQQAARQRDAILAEWADGETWMAEALLNEQGK